MTHMINLDYILKIRHIFYKGPCDSNVSLFDIKNTKKQIQKQIFVTLPHSALLVLNTDFNFVQITTLRLILRGNAAKMLIFHFS